MTLELTVRAPASVSVHEPILLDVTAVNRSAEAEAIPDFTNHPDAPLLRVTTPSGRTLEARPRDAEARFVGDAFNPSPSPPTVSLEPEKALTTRLDLLRLVGALGAGEHEVVAVLPDGSEGVARVRIEPARVRVAA